MQVYGDQTYNHNPGVMKAFRVTNMTLWEAGGADGGRVRLAFDDCGWRFCYN